MDDEDFKQTVLYYINTVAAQRHRDIMATFAEITTQQDAMLAAIEDLAKENSAALDVLKDTGAAGHAGVLDQIGIRNAQIIEVIKNKSGELKSKIATTPMPGAAPGPQ